MQNNIFDSFHKNNQYQQYLNEFEKEISSHSDRGIVLICGSIIDSMLSELLKAFLINHKGVEKEILNSNGVLGTFDSKIKMAYYLGLITSGEKRNLEILQRVRNKFAHQVLNISFEDNAITNICSNFNLPENSFLPPRIPFPDEETGELPKLDLNPIKKDTKPKDRYIIAFRYLFRTLGDRCFFGNIDKRMECKKELNAEASIENQIKVISKLKEKIQVLKENSDVSRKDFSLYEELFKRLAPFQEYCLEVIRNSMK